MPAPETNALHRVVGHALRLHEAVQRGERRDLDREQALLTNLVLELPGGEKGSPDLGPRYAVVCWLDELFICDSRWASGWNERKLESALYGGNDRAWEFWRQAKLAESQPTDETLAAYYLCVALGFRGELRQQPERLEAWVEKTRTRVTRVSPRPTVRPSRRMAKAPRLLGDSRLRRFTTVATVATIALLPVAAYAVMHRVLG